jgi:hypothetical protein
MYKFQNLLPIRLNPFGIGPHWILADQECPIQLSDGQLIIGFPILQRDVLALKVACHSDEESGRMFGHCEVLKNTVESGSFELLD